MNLLRLTAFLLLALSILSTNAPAQQIEKFRPPIIGYVKSLDELESDLTYLSLLGLKRATIVEALESNFDFGLSVPLKMKGVDRTKPVGFYTSFPRANDPAESNYAVVAFGLARKNRLSESFVGIYLD
jgi:hypothetical protein